MSNENESNRYLDYCILQDKREQIPWDFTFLGPSQELVTLKTGDYSLSGYEDCLCIERKRTTGELAQNLGSKSKQFFAEMERMSKFEYKYLILEFSEDMLARFPEDSGIPQSKHKSLRIHPNFLSASLEKIKSQYDVEVIFAGGRNNAIDEALRIFNKVVTDGPVRRPIF